MSTTIDYLVVGSGLSALSFAALAAHKGKRVVVVEAHELAGGYGHTFRYGKPPNEYAFNAQLHYVWNCGPGRPVDSFLRKLGLGDEVTFESFDPDGFDRMRMPGWSLDIPYDYDVLIGRLAELFPAHADACRGFVDEVRGLAAELDELPPPPRAPRMLLRLHRFRRVLRNKSVTLQQVFDRFDLPKEAQALLALQWPDFLLPPDRLSFFAWVMLFSGYCRGASYPTRHFEHVVDSMVEHIRSRGGEVLLQHRVVEFLRSGDRIVGAVTEDVDPKGRPLGTRKSLEAKEVICNMDPRQAAEMIGLHRFSGRVRRQLDYDYSVSSFMAYCVVDHIDLREHGFGRSNLFHAEHPDLNRAFDDMVIRGDYSNVSFAMTVPTLMTDHRTDCAEGKTIVEFLTVADYSRFLQLKIGGERAYVAKKKEIFEAILDVVERDYVPGFRDKLCFKLLGSPTTNQRFCGAPAGHAYGSNMTPHNISPNRLTSDSSVPGLHFCSASAGFAGFAGTIWTGCTLYERLEQDPVLTGPHVQSA